MDRRDRIGGRLDPVVSTLSRWADENPEVMGRLLTDPVLQQQFLAALDEIVGGGEAAKPNSYRERYSDAVPSFSEKRIARLAPHAFRSSQRGDVLPYPA